MAVHQPNHTVELLSYQQCIGHIFIHFGNQCTDIDGGSDCNITDMRGYDPMKNIRVQGFGSKKNDKRFGFGVPLKEKLQEASGLGFGTKKSSKKVLVRGFGFQKKIRALKVRFGTVSLFNFS